MSLVVNSLIAIKCREKIIRSSQPSFCLPGGQIMRSYLPLNICRKRSSGTLLRWFKMPYVIGSFITELILVLCTHKRAFIVPSEQTHRAKSVTLSSKSAWTLCEFCYLFSVFTGGLLHNNFLIYSFLLVSFLEFPGLLPLKC